VLAAGFPDSSTYYRKADETLGMTAKQYRNGASSVTVRFAVTDCELGRCLVAESERGICAILLGDNDDTLIAELRALFPLAQSESADGEFRARIDRVISSLTQHAIPCGETASYQQVAQAIGKPNALRAVASACAANKLAIVIPCHRVVRRDGALSGYRWGVERKAQLLKREAKIQEE